MEILFDSQEKKKTHLNYLKKIYDVEITTLAIGDILVPEKGICFERKTIADFVGSVKSGHLQKQLMQMEQNYEHVYLLISGSLNDLRFNKYVQWSVEQHLGSLASFSVRTRVKILQVSNDTQLAKLVDKIIKKTGDGKSLTIRDTELMKNTFTTADMKVKILTCFHRVGLKKAEKLLKDEEINNIVTKLIDKIK